MKRTILLVSAAIVFVVGLTIFIMNLSGRNGRRRQSAMVRCDKLDGQTGVYEPDKNLPIRPNNGEPGQPCGLPYTDHTPVLGTETF